MPGPEAYQLLILQHQNYVRALARNIHKKLPNHVEFDDVVQFGQIGLAQAASSYDAGRGVNFKTFAYTRIRGAIFDGLARMSGATGKPGGPEQPLQRELVREAALNAVSEDLQASGAAQAGEQTLADVFSQTTGRLVMVLLLSQLPDDNCPEPCAQDHPARDCETRELAGRLRGLIDGLPPDQAAIVRMHYFEGRSFTDCAATLGKHKAWISRLHTRALDMLRDQLDGARSQAA